MSQQSLTFLSAPANNIYKTIPKPLGGTEAFKSVNKVTTTTTDSNGNPTDNITQSHDSISHTIGVGTMQLKKQTYNSLKQIRQKDTDKELNYERDRDMRLCEFHYMTMLKGKQDRNRLGCLDLPPKPVGSIPGYSGFIPRKESANVIGETYKTSNLQSAQLFSQEQEVSRRNFENIKGPSNDLKTPDTSDMSGSDVGVL